MITLLSCYFFKFVPFLIYPTEVKLLKCAKSGAITVSMTRKCTVIDTDYSMALRGKDTEQ